MKVSDYIMQQLVRHGISDIFMLTGGGAMHLDDSIGRCDGLRYVCNHHEQACAIAAEGYARVRGGMGAVCVTTGPGGTNALTGVLGQWLDSIPVIYISGQVRTDVTIASTGLPLRQLGDQEADIITLVRPITKYAVTVWRPEEIGYHLSRALFEARSGRPGPVWLDIPLDVQAAKVDVAALQVFDAQTETRATACGNVAGQAQEVLAAIRDAKRPILFVGAGVQLAGARQELRAVVESLGIPVQAAWDAIDLIASDHALYFGRPSTLGQRYANIIFQNADLILSIGCRHNVRQIGYLFPSVARGAYKIVVDVDENELMKKTYVPDLPIRCDAKVFLEALLDALGGDRLAPKRDWIDWCHARNARYPATAEARRGTSSKDCVNPYSFFAELSRLLADDDVVVSSNGSACVMPIQIMEVRTNQRHIVNSGCAAMGYGLPAAIGACIGRGRKQVVCLEGDGSIQLNIQEFATLAYNNLPVKVFVINNGGYLSIRSTQQAYFGGHLVGESPRSGVGLPDIGKVASAYGLGTHRIEDPSEMGRVISEVLQAEGPVVCEVMVDPEQKFTPRVTSQKLSSGKMVSKPLEDMWPFLDPEELMSNMIVPSWEDERAGSA